MKLINFVIILYYLNNGKSQILIEKNLNLNFINVTTYLLKNQFEFAKKIVFHYNNNNNNDLTDEINEIIKSVGGPSTVNAEEELFYINEIDLRTPSDVVFFSNYFHDFPQILNKTHWNRRTIFILAYTQINITKKQLLNIFQYHY